MRSICTAFCGRAFALGLMLLVFGLAFPVSAFAQGVACSDTFPTSISFRNNALTSQWPDTSTGRSAFRNCNDTLWDKGGSLSVRSQRSHTVDEDYFVVALPNVSDVDATTIPGTSTELHDVVINATDNGADVGLTASCVGANLSAAISSGQIRLVLPDPQLTGQTQTSCQLNVQTSNYSTEQGGVVPGFTFVGTLRRLNQTGGDRYELVNGTLSGGGLSGGVLQPPTISSISPNSGPAAGGTNVTINGTNFDQVVDVFFGSSTSTMFSINASRTQIVAVTPTGTAGPVNVVVQTNSAGSVTASGGFTYVSSDTTGPTVEISAPSETRGPFTANFDFSEDVTGFEPTDIVVGNGTVSELSGSGSNYTVTIAPTSSNTAQSQITIDVPAGVASDAAGNPNEAAEQVTVEFIDEDFIRTRTQRVISNFLSRRADQITANDPNLLSRLQKGGGTGGGAPVGFTAQGTEQNNQFTFATSLRQIASAGRSQKEEQIRKSGLLSLGAFQQESLSGGLVNEGFDIWVQGKLVQIDSLSASSDLGLLYVGADYRVNESLVVGLLAQFDWTDETDDVEDTEVDGTGWMVGPYIAARLHENLLFDGRVAFGQSKNDVDAVGAGSSRFDGNRWLVKGQLTGDFDQGGFNISPHVGVIYFEEEQESFTDTLNVLIPSQTVSLGRVTFGPKISTTYRSQDGLTVSPHVGIRGIWDFDQAEIVDLTSGLAAGSDDFRGRVEGGLSLSMANGITIAGEGFYDGIGSDDFEAYGGSAKLRVPLN